MKKKSKEKKKNNVAHTMIIVLALVMTIVLFQNQTEKYPKESSIQEKTLKEPPEISMTDNQILNNLKNFPELKPYADYDARVTHLSANDLEPLKEKQPVIYADLEGKSLYRIEYTSTTDGYLVIYDTENDRILKQFRILNMQLNN